MLTNERVQAEVYRWFFGKISALKRVTLDVDSTVITRNGNQQGAARGYNPNRHGRASHHPLLAFVAEARMVAGGIGRLRVAFGLWRMSHSAWDTLTISKDRRPVLCALAFELENVRLVVTDVLKQLVPDWPLAIEAPAPQGFQADLPAEGKLPFSHHGVVHLLLLSR